MEYECSRFKDPFKFTLIFRLATALVPKYEFFIHKFKGLRIGGSIIFLFLLNRTLKFKWRYLKQVCFFFFLCYY